MGAPQNTGPSFVLSGHVNQFNLTGQVNMVLVGNNLYAVVSEIGAGGANINGTSIFKSTDGGTTWTQMDAAHRPTTGQGCAFYDTTGNQLIFGFADDTDLTLRPTKLKNFSFSTDTWGADYATGGPNALTSVWYTFKRPDGTILIIFNLGTLQPGGQSNLQAAYWNGSAWSANIDVGSGIVALQANGRCAGADTVAAMDSNGNISIAFDNNLRTIFCYQQLKSDNTLGTFIHFAQTFQNNAPPFGKMLISGSNIYFTATTNNSVNNTIFVGTPLVGPTFTATSPAALVPPMHGVNLPGDLVVDSSGNLYWMVTWQDAGFNNVFQVAKSTDNGTTWAFLADNVTANYFYDFTSSTLAPNTDPSFGISGPSLLLGSYRGNTTLFGMTNVNNSVTTSQNAYFLNSEVLGTAPGTTTKLEISFFGTKRWEKEPDVACEELPEPKPIKLVM